MQLIKTTHPSFFLVRKLQFKKHTIIKKSKVVPKEVTKPVKIIKINTQSFSRKKLYIDLGFLVLLLFVVRYFIVIKLLIMFAIIKRIIIAQGFFIIGWLFVLFVQIERKVKYLLNNLTDKHWHY